MAKKDKEKGHFTGRGECKIHTSKEGTCDAFADVGCGYATNCDDPKVTWETTAAPWQNANRQTEWEAHHILCVEAVNWYQVMSSKTYDSDAKADIDAVYRKTVWCINQKANMIALPRKRVYINYPESRTQNLPCHCWDHNVVDGYIDEVREALHTRIWQKIKEAGDDKDLCDLADKVAKVELEALSRSFKAKLLKRGRRSVGSKRGTAAAWDQSQTPEKDRAPLWWFPFSMASDTVALTRPAVAVKGGGWFKPDWSASARHEQRTNKFR